MKIVYYYDAIARLGGVERIYVEKMNYLAEQYNQEVILLTTCQGNHPFTYPLSNKVIHIDLGIRFHTKYQYSLIKRLFMGWKMDNEFRLKLKNTINDIAPDIIVATNIYAADSICNLNCKAKKIIESHIARNSKGIDGIHRNKIHEFLRKIKIQKYNRIIERKSDAVVTLTHGDAKEWNAKNIITIPNIIDIIHDQSYSKLTNKIALFAGRFSYQKGLERMLEAWKIVINKRNDWVLKLVGEGEQKKVLIEQCKMLGIEKTVIFKETTKNMMEEYRNASMFLMTSRYEGFGLVLVEAMQCGVPCISFDCPYGPADIIKNGENGILVGNENIEEFANAILKLIDDEDLRKKMGKAAIESSKDYLPERIMPQWIDLFNKLTTDNIQ